MSNDGKKHGDQKLTAYLGHILTPRSFEEYDEIRQGALLVNEDGRIIAVGTKADIINRYRPQSLVDFETKLILPGMIDLHVHLVQIAQTGRSGDTLLGWLDKYIFPAEIRFSDPAHARKMARWFFEDLAANGTTLASVFTSIHAEATNIAFETAAQYGSRVIMGKVMMDANSPEALTEDTQASLQQSEELCKRWHGHDSGRLLYAFTPRFAPTSTSGLMAGAARLWKKHPGTFMQTHLSENVDEIAWVRELFPQCWNYLDVYRSHGLTGSNSLFAHSIHLDDGEIRKLVQDDCGVAHCPSSNFFLKSGVFPYTRMRKANVKFGLGSDIAAGPEMNIFRVMRDASYIQHDLWISPSELFYMATLAGAKALNLDDKLGSLEVGKEADFIIIDPARKSGVAQDILDKPSDDILSSLVYVGDDRMVAATYVRGRCIYQAREAILHSQDRLPLNT